LTLKNSLPLRNFFLPHRLATGNFVDVDVKMCIREGAFA
jgi:hypothetical protein